MGNQGSLMHMGNKGWQFNFFLPFSFISDSCKTQLDVTALQRITFYYPVLLGFILRLNTSIKY